MALRVIMSSDFRDSRLSRYRCTLERGLLKKILKLFGKSESVYGDLDLINAVHAHVESWVGEPVILHEKVSETIHIDIYWVAPSDERPFHTLVTSGMAQKAMKVPKGAEACLYAELVMFLPSDWPMDRILEDEAAFWPIRVMKQLARYPHDHNTWLWLGHTVQLGEDGLPFDSVLLDFPMLLESSGCALPLPDGRKVMFLGMILLRPEEREFCMANDSEAFMDLVEEQERFAEVLVLDLGRESVV